MGFDTAKIIRGRARLSPRHAEPGEIWHTRPREPGHFTSNGNNAGALRTERRSWADIATTLRERFRLNARVALRLAHGWSQREAAEQWCRRWPDDPKTLKNFSTWEQWPGSTGHAPSLSTLDRLACLYECSVGDLLADLPGYGHLDVATNLPSAILGSSGKLTGERVEADSVLTAEFDLLREYGVPAGSAGSVSRRVGLGAPLFGQLQEVDYGGLARAVVMWADHATPGLSRRDLLAHLSAAFAMAAASPMLTGLDDDERQHVGHTVAAPSRFDVASLDYCEAMMGSLRRQGDVLGARLTMQSALGHQRLAEQLVRLAPSAHRSRALSTYAELTQLVGWLCFNAGEQRSAQYYYDEARSAAHDAQNVELVTYILCTMSHLATWQGKPRVGIDHAVAARSWAQQSGSSHAQAYAADIAARAFSADGQQTATREALDAEHLALMECTTTPDTSSWWYFYDEAFYWSTKSECALNLRDPESALQAVDDSEGLIDRSNLHNLAFRILFRAEAYLQQENVPGAAQAIGEAAVLAAANTSQRIDQRILDLRSALVPWQRNKPVRVLDELLADCRQMPSGNGRM